MLYGIVMLKLLFAVNAIERVPGFTGAKQKKPQLIKK
jgi:hypothetical protein